MKLMTEWNGDECSVSVRGWMGDMQCEKRREREAETKKKARRQSECRGNEEDLEAMQKPIIQS